MYRFYVICYQTFVRYHDLRALGTNTIYLLNLIITHMMVSSGEPFLLYATYTDPGLHIYAFFASLYVATIHLLKTTIRRFLGCVYAPPKQHILTYVYQHVQLYKTYVQLSAYSCTRRCISTRVSRIRGKNSVYVIRANYRIRCKNSVYGHRTAHVYVLKRAYTNIEPHTYMCEK